MEGGSGLTTMRVSKIRPDAHMGDAKPDIMAAQGKVSRSEVTNKMSSGHKDLVYPSRPRILLGEGVPGQTLDGIDR